MNEETIVEEIERMEIREPPPLVSNIIRSMNDLKAIRTFIKNELVEDVDFGSIPGTTDKKVLLLAGGQKVAMYFNLRPVYHATRNELGDGHLEVYVRTDLINRSDEKVYGSGLGSCTTMESKYRYRTAERACPKCGKATIYRGKKFKPADPETWFCWKKKDGCGSVFPINDPEIVSQEAGKKENENIHDQRNTVLKIAAKRSFLSGVVGIGCLSELFTVDLEDFYDLTPVENGPQNDKEAPQKADLPVGDAAGKAILDRASETFLDAKTYNQLLKTYQMDETAARRFGVFEQYTGIRTTAFKALRDKIEDAGGAPLLPLPADHEDAWLEFMALDEAYRKGDKDLANRVFFECREAMNQAGLSAEWKQYAADLKKTVTA